MLAPVLGVVFTLVLASFFISTISDQRATLSKIQLNTMDNSRSLAQLASRLATNHARVYELLKFADEDGDEARLYDMGKPLLNEVHKIEADVLIATKVIDSTDSVLKTVTEYRKQIITAVEMSTVDLSLAYQYMTLATTQFNKANAAFLKLNNKMQNELETQLTHFQESNDKTLRQFSVAFFLICLLALVVSYLLSKLLSRDIYNSINILNKLTNNNEIIKNKSEVTQLNHVINHVQLNHRLLEKTRNDLNRQQRQLHSILDNMVDAVITIDEEGIVLSFNRAAEMTFGYTENEIVGHNINKIIPDPQAELHQNYLQHYLKTGESHVLDHGREVKAQRKNKEIFPIHISISELPDTLNNKKCFIGTCRDITKSKQQEEQLRISQKMDALGKLTGGIAHDYNNMLGVIIGYADLLVSTLADQPENKNYADKITHAARRGVKLTSKLMSFSRVKQNEAITLDINNLLLSQKSMLEKTLTVRIKLTFDLCPDIWPIKVDYGDLEDAILNICINAMHAIELNGQLSIQTKNITLEQEDANSLKLQPGDYTLMNIMDTGQGMSEEVISKIFDPFYSTKGEKGNGLGLTQVYGFMQRSHGLIKAYSQPGHGTHFALYFPRVEQDILPTEKTEEVKTDLRLNGNETILIVDDEPDLLNLCSELLQQYGYHAIKTNDALEALEILKGKNIDLLISDVIMPDIDGFELAAIVQKKYPHIKIQLVSGFTDNRHLNTHDKILHENLIHKPYNPQALLSRIRQLLNNSSATD